ncbi:hypothetical protein OZ410_12660, partial [Robiginitalea sp. M366]|uniref:beta strand repeat-containing protein n=1 Tax=Robiginitalea aestuariiviva TaxID=3036903 RepID=UPI00240D9B09
DAAANFTATDVEGALAELAAGSTDDQNISGSGLAGTTLTIGIENGTGETVDLSSLVNDADADPTNEYNTGISFDGTNLTVTDAGGNQSVDISGVSTDDQTAAEVTYSNATSGLTATDVQAAIDEVAAGSTDDQNISGSGLAGTTLTIGIENGTGETVDLSSLVNDADADPTNEYNTGISFDGTNLTVTDAGGNQSVDISGVSTDDQNISGSGLAGTTLTIGIENGTSETVDLSSLVNDADADPTNEYNTGISFDGTNLTVTDAGGNQSVDISGVSTDDQNISGSALVGTDLTIGIENGTSETIDLSSLVGTDDQTAAEVSIADAAANFTATDVEGALAELAAGSTDDQTISTDGTAGNLSIESGNTITLNVDDADADPTNEYNTGVAMNGGALEVTDGGGTQSANLVSTDANNDIAVGTDGALYLNVASVTIAETVTNLSDNGDGTFTYVNESGASQTVAKSDITANGDGTYTFTNNDGSDVILDTRAASNPYDNSTSGLTATDVQAAIDEVATGSTDDQNISGSGLAGTTLTIGIENGTGETVDLSSLVNDADADPTNEYNTGISFDGTNLTVTDAGGNQTVDISGVSTDDQTAAEVTYSNTTSGLTATDVQAAIDEVAAGSTDDQTISLTGNTLAIESGNSIDLSGYLDNTDDQTAAEVSIADAAANFTATDVEGALAELAAGSTDDQTISLTGNTLAIESGNSVDLSGYLDNTDDQTISLTGNTLAIESGNSVDLSGYLDNTDDQTAAEVSIADAAANFTATDVEGALAELAAGSTDDQNISGSGLAGTTLTIGIENGTSETVDLSSLVNDADADPTNEYNTGISFDGTNLTVTDAGGNQSVDISGVSTDDQNISGSGLAGTTLTIGIENGTSETVDLSSLVNDADADPTNEYNTGISFDGTNLTVTDAGGNQSVDISGVSTDDQNISGSALVGTDLTIGIENGTSETIDLSSLVGTDDQTAAEVTYSNATSGLTAMDVQAAIDEVAAGSTDDQNISGSGLSGTTLTIGIENGTGETVDLSSLVNDADADPTNEYNTGISFDGTNLTVTDAGGNQSVDISGVSTDDQNISGSGLAGTTLTIGIENGTSETVDLSSLVNDADADPTNEYNTGISFDGTNLTVTDAGGNQSVDISGVSTDDQTAAEVSIADAAANFTATDVEGALAELAAGSTDDQTISLTGNTLAIESGNSIDLSGYLDNTDDQTAAEVTYSNATSGLTATDVQAAIDEVAAGSTDDQNISGSGLAGTTLTIGIENGTSETVDLSSLVNDADADPTNEYNTGISFDGTTLTVTDAGGNQTVDISGVSTDDQNISLTGNTLAIESGNSIDLSGYLDNTDDQTAAEVTYSNATSGLTATDVQAAIDEVAAGSTDDQNISGSGLAGTTLTIGIENGTGETVDLSSLVNDADADPTNEYNTGISFDGTTLTVTDAGGNQSVDISGVSTDDQTAAEVSIADAAANFTATDVEGALAELAAGSTDDQNISGSALVGTDLTIGIENGTSETIDLSSLVGTDDQTAAEVTYSNATSGLTATDVQAAIDEVAAGSTDDQNISGSGLAGTTLTIGIENGTGETVDLSSLVNDADADPTNEYNTGISFDGTTLTVTDAGGNQSVDISGVSTDDQTAAEVTYSNATSGLTATDVQAAIDEVAAGSTDDQNISGSALVGTDLTIGIENGTSETVDLSSLVGTDDQTAAEVSIADAAANFTATDVEGALAELAAGSTDDQTISLTGNTLAIESGNSVDLSGYLDNTDDQTISLTGNTLAIESGNSIDLSGYLDNTDDQTAAEVTYSNATSGLTATDVQAAIDEVAAGSTDDQTISLTGNTLAIESGNSVDLSGYLDNTDAQTLSTDGTAGNISVSGGNTITLNVDDADADATNEIQDLSLTGNSLALSGDATPVDLSGYLDNTDDQTAAEVSIADAAANFTATDVEGALAELAAGSTDDQNISGSGLAGTTLTIGIENGTSETVDLSSLVNDADADPTNEYNTGISFDGTNLTVTDAGGNQSVDISGVSTDDQTAAEVTYSNATSGLTATDVQAAIDEVAAGSTDDQNISGSALVGTDLTIGIENGTSETVDLSSLVGTDDQTAAEVSIADAAANFTATDVEGALAELAAGSTDDQNISGSALVGTDLTIGIENGTSETVDLSSLVGTDDQTAAEVSIADAAANFTATDVEGALAELAAGSTDDQTISLTGNTLAIESGNSVDLSGYLDNTDAQTLSTDGTAGNISVSGGNTITLNVDDADADATNEIQDLSLTGNSLALSGDATPVDLSGYLDNTDDQTAAEVTYSNATSGLTATDVQAAIDEVAAGSTDDQYDDEVPLRTPIDVDEGGEASPTAETNVQEVINAIAPITSKAARIFYPPSIAIDASTNGSGYTVDLYAQYVAQFGTPAVASSGAPAALPTYGATELYYYVTYADPAVFANMSIDANGVLTYDIIGQPADYNSLINVVFVVK